MFGLSKKVLILTSLPLLLIIMVGFIYIFSPIPVKPKRIGVLFYQNNPTTLPRHLSGQYVSNFKKGRQKAGSATDYHRQRVNRYRCPYHNG